MSSYSVSESTTFTLTHAKHMSAKVAADLKRMQRLYGSPSDTQIASYEAEMIEVLKAGYLGTLTVGYRRNGNWIEPTLRYTARDLFGTVANDDDPGRVKPNCDIANASFYNYLTYNTTYHAATAAERDTFHRRLPFQRVGAEEPGITGYLVDDRSYSAGGRALARASVRSF